MPLPNMANTLNGWELPIVLKKRIQNVVGGLLVTNYQTFRFMGVCQPLRDEQLQFKPENMRSWEWIWIHTKANYLKLETADTVIYDNKDYKVMSVKNYDKYGYIEYELCRGYDGQGS